jgi:hypothetical protein
MADRRIDEYKNEQLIEGWRCSEKDSVMEEFGLLVREGVMN